MEAKTEHQAGMLVAFLGNEEFLLHKLVVDA